jgi:hypothetical protein
MSAQFYGPELLGVCPDHSSVRLKRDGRAQGLPLQALATPEVCDRDTWTPMHGT